MPGPQLPQPAVEPEQPVPRLSPFPVVTKSAVMRDIAVTPHAQLVPPPLIQTSGTSKIGSLQSVLTCCYSRPLCGESGEVVAIVAVLYVCMCVCLFCLIFRRYVGCRWIS